MPWSDLARKSKLSIALRQRVEAARPVFSRLLVYMLQSEEVAARAVKFCSNCHLAQRNGSLLSFVKKFDPG
jgi:hypothetical protein